MSDSIHLHRKLLDSDVWHLPATRLKVWLLLLLRAAPVTREVHITGRRFVEARGRIVESEQVLATMAGMSPSSFRKCLLELADDDGRITVARGKSLGRGRVRIVVCNYDEFQVPCLAPEREETMPTDESELSRETRVGAVAWMDQKRDVAVSRLEAMRKRVAALRGRYPDLSHPRAIMSAAGEVWTGCDATDWLGLYDVFWQEVFGSRSAEIITARKKDLTAYASVIKRMLVAFHTWSSVARVPAEGLCYDYIRWRFDREIEKNEWCVANSRTRNPIALSNCFTTDAGVLDRWWTSRRMGELKTGRRS